MFSIDNEGGYETFKEFIKFLTGFERTGKFLNDL